MSETLIDDRAAPDPGDDLPTSTVDGPDAPVDGDLDGQPRGRLGSAWHRFLNMPVEGWITLFVVASCAAFVFATLNWGNGGAGTPGVGWVLTKNTPAGGDMGAHVWAPAYLRDHLPAGG